MNKPKCILETEAAIAKFESERRELTQFMWDNRELWHDYVTAHAESKRLTTRVMRVSLLLTNKLREKYNEDQINTIHKFVGVLRGNNKSDRKMYKEVLNNMNHFLVCDPAIVYRFIVAPEDEALALYRENRFLMQVSTKNGAEILAWRLTFNNT